MAARRDVQEGTAWGERHSMGCEVGCGVGGGLWDEESDNDGNAGTGQGINRGIISSSVPNQLHQWSGIWWDEQRRDFHLLARCHKSLCWILDALPGYNNGILDPSDGCGQIALFLGPLQIWPVKPRGQTPNSSPKVKIELH